MTKIKKRTFATFSQLPKKTNKNNTDKTSFSAFATFLPVRLGVQKNDCFLDRPAPKPRGTRITHFPWKQPPNFKNRWFYYRKINISDLYHHRTIGKTIILKNERRQRMVISLLISKNIVFPWWNDSSKSEIVFFLKWNHRLLMHRATFFKKNANPASSHVDPKRLRFPSNRSFKKTARLFRGIVLSTPWASFWTICVKEFIKNPFIKTDFKEFHLHSINNFLDQI